MEKFSYSKIEVFESCAYKYKLVYVDKHFIQQNSIATDFGSLIHFIEETIANKLKNNESLDYAELTDMFFNLDKKEGKKHLYGVNKLKELYPNDYYIADKNGLSYKDKEEIYIDSGICRLEDYLVTHPELEVYEAEKPFEIDYKGYIFQGSIDRIFRNKITGDFIIEDIKTYSAPLDKQALTTPLQFVIYKKAFEEISREHNVICKYDLPLCNVKQEAGTTNFVDRGFKKIDSLLAGIEAKNFAPHPSPLCHWCIFSKTYPNQPEEAKNLCPYFSHWTKEQRDFSVENEWMGEDNHQAILEAFIDSETNEIKIKPKIEIKNEKRRLLIRK